MRSPHPASLSASGFVCNYAQLDAGTIRQDSRIGRAEGRARRVGGIGAFFESARGAEVAEFL